MVDVSVLEIFIVVVAEVSVTDVSVVVVDVFVLEVCDVVIDVPVVELRLDVSVVLMKVELLVLSRSFSRFLYSTLLR